MTVATRLIDKLKITNVNVFKAAGNVTMSNEGVVVVNKTSGAATTVTLTPSPEAGDFVFVKDGKGDAASNNITVQGAASATIDGASSYVITSNYGGAIFCWNGTEWNVITTPGGTAGTFTNLTVTGTEAVTGNATLSGAKLTVAANTVVLGGVGTLAAAGSVQANAAQIAAATTTVTGADGTKGVILPATPVVGQEVSVINTAGSTLKVYPDSSGTGGTINGGSANASVNLATLKSATYVCTNTTGANQWWSLSN